LTGSYTGGLLGLSVLGLLAMTLVLVLGHDTSLEHAPEERPQSITP
jgi:hypothetical protein